MYQCFPAEDVGVEAEVVLRDVDAALQENVALEGARVVDDEPLLHRQFLEDALEILAARTIGRVQHVVPRGLALPAAPALLPQSSIFITNIISITLNPKMMP